MPGEAAIIEALGTEHFFDPSTGALLSVVPELPDVAPYRCRTRGPATGTWIEHNARRRPLGRAPRPGAARSAA